MSDEKVTTGITPSEADVFSAGWNAAIERLDTASKQGMTTGPKEWARIDKDGNVVFLDMDKCAAGPSNLYTALGVAIWNAAIDAAIAATEGYHGAQAAIRVLKK